MTGPERGSTPTFVLISRVWAVAGALALVVALVTKSLVVAVFGGLALLAAAIVFGLQAAQDRSVERNSRVIGGSMPPPPPTLASDVLGRPRREPRPEEPPGPGTDAAPDLPEDDRDDGGGADDATAPVDPAATRRTGPRRRPEPDVPRTARNRGRRNPLAGRDTGPLPTQSADGASSAEEGSGQAEEGRGHAEEGRGHAEEDEVVDEPTVPREPEDSEIDDAETVDETVDETEDGNHAGDDAGVADERADGPRRH